MASRKRPLIALTMGDPAGIGPEIIAKYFCSDLSSYVYTPVVIGDATLIEQTAKKLSLPLDYTAVQSIEEVDQKNPTLWILDTIKCDYHNIIPGKVNKACGHAAFLSVKTAIRLCMEEKVSGMVTTPINKAALHLAGHNYDGHTEILGIFTQTQKYRLLLATERLKIIHTSTHVSLRDACNLVTKQCVFDTIQLGYQHLLQLGYKNPKIAVCGLNPHAGENGLFGQEDIEEIKPAVIAAQKEGIHIDGPLPGDTTFMKAYRGEYDLIVAQFHDQGHVPAKMVSFDSGVNITIGIPIIRTSVDHGTAFDIAGKGLASSTNLGHALAYAFNLIRRSSDN